MMCRKNKQEDKKPEGTKPEGESKPINGRTFWDLLATIPGMVITALIIYIIVGVIFYFVHINTGREFSYNILYSIGEDCENVIDLEEICSTNQFTQKETSVPPEPTHDIDSENQEPQLPDTTENPPGVTIQTQIVPTQENEQDEEVYWDFGDGFISSDWRVWTKCNARLEDSNEPDNGIDCSNIGYEGIDQSQLQIVLDKWDGPYNYGISHEIPNGVRSFKITFVINSMEVENAGYPIKLIFGFLETRNATTNKSSLQAVEGEYIYIWRESNRFLPYIYYSTPNETGELIGIDKFHLGDEITMSCDLFGRTKISCKFSRNGLAFDGESTQILSSWNSLYIGTQVNLGGYMDVVIEEIQLIVSK